MPLVLASTISESVFAKRIKLGALPERVMLMPVPTVMVGFALLKVTGWLAVDAATVAERVPQRFVVSHTFTVAVPAADP